MHILLAVGVTTLLTAGSPSQGQQPTLVATPPITITFVNAAFEDALAALAKISGVMIEIDQTVSAEIRRQPVYDSAISVREVSLEQTIETLTRLKGLSYSIVDAKMVRIFKKA
jgi:hypothetical protein